MNLTPIDVHLRGIIILLLCIIALLAIPRYLDLGLPAIEGSCTMNGIGAGTCEFLNSGDGKGTQTVTITVTNCRTRATKETTLYSGVVEAKDVRTRPFNVLGIQELCAFQYDHGETWRDVCDFTVLTHPAD